MQVLFDAQILRNEHMTGVERYASRVLESVAKNSCHKFELSALTTTPFSQLSPRNVPTHTFAPMFGFNTLLPISIPSSFWNQFDVVHCPTVLLPFWTKPKHLKLIVTVHDLIPIVAGQFHTAWMRVYFQRFLPRMLQQVDHFIAVSETTKTDVLRSFPFVVEDQVDVVGEASFVQLKTEPQVRKAAYFLTVGTIEPRKNFVKVIDAFVKLKRSGALAGYELKMAGVDGWKNQDIKKRIGDAPGIQWLGHVSDKALIQLYDSATAMIYPSYYEGFGLPVLEAMARGCPVITSNVSSLPEVGGDAALYVDPNSVDQISEKMIRLAEDPELVASLSTQGLVRSQQFSWEKAASETIQIYQKVASAK